MFVNKNFSKLSLLVQEVCYPKYLINRILFSTSRSAVISVGRPSPLPRLLWLLSSHVNPISALNIKFSVRPKVKVLTFKLIKFLKSDFSIKIDKKTVELVGKLFTHLKAETCNFHKNNIEYRVECKNCNLKYVCQSSTRLKDRMVSHAIDMRLWKKFLFYVKTEVGLRDPLLKCTSLMRNLIIWIGDQIVRAPTLFTEVF